MKKSILIGFLCIISMQVLLAQQLSKIDVSLQEEIKFHEEGELIRVNILLNAQYDQMELRAKANLFQNKKAKRAFVVQELKDFSEASQKNVIKRLTDSSQRGTVSRIRSHWVANFINCYADVDMIEELSLHPDVLMISLDKMEDMLPKEKQGNAQKAEIPYHITQVNADKVWGEGCTGEGVIVAVLDTGVNYHHADLAGNMWEHPNYPYHGYDFINDDNNPMDDHSHGTHCAGIVAGTGASGIQTGIAPNSKIMAIKVLGTDGGTMEALYAGTEFAIDYGADIISLSLGVFGGGDDMTKMISRQSMVNTLEAGVIVTAISGNEADDIWEYPIPNNVRTPGNCPPPWLHPDQTITGGLSAVVCIGATDENDLPAYFTSEGPVTWKNISEFYDYSYNPGIGLIRPDVSAPGVRITSLAYFDNSSYLEMSGTSMATPCVAGIMALMLSKDPDLTPAEICRILETTAKPLSEKKNNITGSGRVDAWAAFNEIGKSPLPITLEDFWIDDSENNNGVLEPGETANLIISVKNNGEAILEDVVGTLTSESPLVTITEATLEYGNFETDQVKNAEFNVKLSPDALISNIDLSFILTLTDKENRKIQLSFIYQYQCKAPSNTAAESISSSSIQITWEETDENQTYSLYRDSELLTSKITGTSYLDTELNPEQSYCYFLKSLCDETVESAPSDEACATTPTGIGDFSENFKIFPNPARDILYIEGEGIEAIAICDLAGRLLQKVKTTSFHTAVNIALLNSGVYIVEILRNDAPKINQRLIVDR